MRMEVLYGQVPGGTGQYILTDSFLIGSDSRCDLILPDPAVSPVNTRIYQKDGLIYIEDLNSSAGTAIGGMRIYAPNMLRSGDQITVGQTCIGVYF